MQFCLNFFHKSYVSVYVFMHLFIYAFIHLCISAFMSQARILQMIINHQMHFFIKEERMLDYKERFLVPQSSSKFADIRQMTNI